MNEEKNSETSSSSDGNEDNDTERNLRGFNNLLDTESMGENKQTTTSSVVFQELLRKIEEVSNNEHDRRNLIRQGISLSNELMGTIEKTTSFSGHDFDNCWQPLIKMLLDIESIVLVKDEKLFIREIFFALLDLLSKSQIRSYFNGDRDMKILHNVCCKCLANTFLSLISKTAGFVSLTYDDIALCKYTDTFCAMYKRASYDLQYRLLDEEPETAQRETTSLILSCFWNLAYSTVIVPWLLDIGLIKSILGWLKITKLSSQTVQGIVNIIHNISRHDDGADELRKFDGLLIIKSFQIIRGNDFSNEINLILSMIIALLSTPEQIRLDSKRMNKTLNQLLQITINADKTKDYLSKRGPESFHVSAPLAVFAKLFVDDRSLEYVINHAKTKPELTVALTIGLFVNLLIDFRDAFTGKDHLRQFTCTALLNILWSISFQNRYQAELRKNENFLMTIKSLSLDNIESVVDKYVLRSMNNMAQATSGILDNLDELADNEDSNTTDPRLISNAASGKPLIMISYARANDQFCDKILPELEKNENLFNVWIDRKHFSSNTYIWLEIARAIKQSSLIVLLLSKDYYNSRSCRKEALFAMKRMKSIIPVYIGDPGDCDWLDIHITEYKYVRFKGNNTELNRGKVQELLETIQATLEEIRTRPEQQQTKQHTVPTQPRKETKIIESINSNEKKPSVEWTVDDIHKWFSDHKVPDTLVKLFDFQSLAEMHRYAAKLRIDSKAEFIKYGQRYAKLYAGEELEEYVFDRFKDALFSLPNNQVKTSMPSGKTSTPNQVLALFYEFSLNSNNLKWIKLTIVF